MRCVHCDTCILKLPGLSSSYRHQCTLIRVALLFWILWRIRCVCLLHIIRHRSGHHKAGTIFNSLIWWYEWFAHAAFPLHNAHTAFEYFYFGVRCVFWVELLMRWVKLVTRDKRRPQSMSQRVSTVQIPFFISLNGYFICLLNKKLFWLNTKYRK